MAKPQSGVITVIVPLSVSFGRQQESLRAVFESRCGKIDLRQYNNNPSMMFHTTPTTLDPRNRQRVTVVTATTGNVLERVVKSTGLQRWPTDERNMCLNQRETVQLPDFGSNVHRYTAKQLPRIPTQEIADMVRTVIKQKNTVESYKRSSGTTVAMPMAAEYFVSATPGGRISPRRERLLTVSSEDDLRVLMATLNGHIGYAWWWIFGDGFDVKLSDFAALTVPDEWIRNPQPAIDMGQRLIDVMPECQVEITIHQKVWRNVNFHLKPDLIAELDRLHIAALGLPEEPLLTHLRIMRSSSSWNYGG